MLNLENINQFIVSNQSFPFLMNTKILKKGSDELEMQISFSSGDFYFNGRLSCIPMFIFIEAIGQGAERLIVTKAGRNGKLYLCSVDQFTISDPTTATHCFDVLKLNISLKQKLGDYYQSYGIISYNQEQWVSGIITHYFEAEDICRRS